MEHLPPKPLLVEIPNYLCVALLSGISGPDHGLGAFMSLLGWIQATQFLPFTVAEVLKHSAALPGASIGPRFLL